MKRWQWLDCAWVWGLVLACGDDTAGDGSDDDSSGPVSDTSGGVDSTSVGSTGASGSIDDTGGSESEATSTDATSTDTTTTADGSCEPVPGDSLYPLEVGRVLSYDPLCVCPCDGGVYTRTVTGTEPKGDREAFVVVSECGRSVSTEYLAPNGVAVDAWDEAASTWGPYVAPPVEGASWDYRGFTWTWTHLGPFEGPGETYDDCWAAVVETDNRTQEVYCLGIGPVSMVGFESSFALRGCAP